MPKVVPKPATVSPPLVSIEGRVIRISEQKLTRWLNNTVAPFLRPTVAIVLGSRRTEIVLATSEGMQHRICADLRKTVLCRGGLVRVLVESIKIKGVGPTVLCDSLSIIGGPVRRRRR
jgi:hypothetical protein